MKTYNNSSAGEKHEAEVAAMICMVIIVTAIVGAIQLVQSKDPDVLCSTFTVDEATCTGAAHGCKVITHTLDGDHPIYNECIPEASDVTAWREYECEACLPDIAAVMEGAPSAELGGLATGLIDEWERGGCVNGCDCGNQYCGCRRWWLCIDDEEKQGTPPPPPPQFTVENGPCSTTQDGNCVGRSSYGNGEECEIRSNGAGTVTRCPIFKTESTYDYVSIDGHKYSGGDCPRGVTLENETSIRWKSDLSRVRTGWQICSDGVSPIGGATSGIADAGVTPATATILGSSAFVIVAYAGIVELRRRKLAAHTQHTMVTQKEDVDSEPASSASDVDGTIIISGEAPSGGDDTSERARLTASV